MGDKETKKEETTEVKVEIPDSYEFKLPEGQEIDKNLVDQVTPIFKDIGLSQEQAQKLVDFYAPYVQQQAEAVGQQQLESYKETVEDWKADTKKQLGADYDKDIAIAARAMDKFGSKELRQVMDDTGLGNNPEVVRFIVKVGKAISEDHFTDPQNVQGKPEGIDPKILYPSMAQ